MAKFDISTANPLTVFLGGTCNGSTWRNEIIPQLKEKGIQYFNPVVDNWTEEDKLIENYIKKVSQIHLYVITPKQKGMYSYFEIMQSINNGKEDVIVCFLKEYDNETFTEDMWKSALASMDILRPHLNVVVTTSLDKIPDLIFNVYKDEVEAHLFC